MSTFPKSCRPIARLFLGLAIPAALLAGCAQAPQQSRSEQAQYTACRREVDRVVVQQNAGALSQVNDESSPYGGGSSLSDTTNRLSILHQRDDMMGDCLNHLDSQPVDTGSATAYPKAAPVSAPVTPPPPDLAGPTSNDLTQPPVLTPSN
jgi:hypothetical protein